MPRKLISFDWAIKCLGTAQKQFYQDDAVILFLVGLSQEEHSGSMRRLRLFK